MTFINFRAVVVLVVIVLLSACSGGSSSSSAPDDEQLDNPASQLRWLPASYRGKTVDTSSPYGLWVLVGTEDYTASGDGETDNGTVQRRMFYTVKPDSGDDPAQIRLCGYADVWSDFARGVDQVRLEATGVNLAYDFTVLNWTPLDEPVYDELSVSMTYRFDDPDSSVVIDSTGDFRAVKISDSTQSDLGMITLTAQAIDYSAITGSGIPISTVIPGLSYSVQCFNETRSPFIVGADIESDIPGLAQSVRDILNSFTAMQSQYFAITDSLNLKMQKIDTDTGSTGYITLLDVNDRVIFSITDASLSDYNYQQLQALTLKGDVAVENHLGETINGSFHLTF